MRKISAAICLLVLTMFTACGSLNLISNDDVISSAKKPFVANITITDNKNEFDVLLTRKSVSVYNAQISYGDIMLTYNFSGEKSSLEGEGLEFDAEFSKIPDTAPIKKLITILDEISYSTTLDVGCGERTSQIFGKTKYGDFIAEIQNSDMSIAKISLPSVEFVANFKTYDEIKAPK